MAPPADAQRARDCASIESDAERLACYDCAGLTSEGERWACYDRALRREPDSILSAPARTPRDTAAPAPPEPPAARTAPAATPAAERRNAERDAEDDEDRTVQVMVVAVHKIRNDARFTTADGEIWLQTDGRSTNLPEPPFQAELRPGAMGSTFLVPTDRRAIRVRRAD